MVAISLTSQFNGSKSYKLDLFTIILVTLEASDLMILTLFRQVDIRGVSEIPDVFTSPVTLNSKISINPFKPASINTFMSF